MSIGPLDLGRLTRLYRVLESIKAGKRLPEARFSNMSIAPKGQKSVYGIFKRKVTVAEDESETPVMAL